MNFQVGQRVVCVNNTPMMWDVSNLDGLTKGRIYTVREIGLHSHIDGGPCIKVEEIIRPIAEEDNGQEIPYWAWRFRPIVERKTDISIFKIILADASKQTEAAE